MIVDVAAGPGQAAQTSRYRGSPREPGSLVRSSTAILFTGGREASRACGEGTVQVNVHKTDLLALGVQVVDDLLGHVADGAHGDDDVLGVRGAVVVEQR